MELLPCNDWVFANLVLGITYWYHFHCLQALEYELEDFGASAAFQEIKANTAVAPNNIAVTKMWWV